MEPLEERRLLSLSAGLLRDTNPALNSGLGEDTEFEAVGGNLFFVGTDRDHGDELWTSDGTSVGTILVKDIHEGPFGSQPRDLANVGDVLFFTASTFDNGKELWRSDGTSIGTVLVKDIDPGALGSGPSYLTNVGGTLFFGAVTAGNGWELWKSNGTSSGTQLVADINPGPNSSAPRNLTAVGSTLYFTAEGPGSGPELWTSDGTSSGTRLVRDLHPAGDSQIAELVDVSGTLYFSANDGVHGEELWTSDGTCSGTQLVVNIATGDESSFPRWLTNVNGTLLFAARTSALNYSLWRYAPGFGAFSVQSPKPLNFIRDLTNVDGTLFFAADTYPEQDELHWSVAPFIAEELVADINPIPTGFLGLTWDSSPRDLTNVNGVLYFSAQTGEPEVSRSTTFPYTYSSPYNRELWRSDGTSSGTHVVTEIGVVTNYVQQSSPQKLSNGSYPTHLTNVQGHLFFRASNNFNSNLKMGDFELWRSDGTPNSTMLVRDVFPGTRSNFPFGADIELEAIGSNLVFEADSLLASDHALGQWAADLWTPNEPLSQFLIEVLGPFAPVYLGAGLFDGLGELESAGSALFLAPTPFEPLFDSLHSYGHLLDVGTEGTELWAIPNASVSPLDISGYLQLDIRPGPDSSFPENLTDVNGALLFTADDGAHGRELWRSNGTSTGTQLVTEIVPGTLGASFSSLFAVGDALYFVANDGTSGEELWVSDGTSSGTRRVLDINSGAAGSGPAELTNVEGVLYFTASDGLLGRELWRTDGTSTGTWRVVDLNSGAGSAAPTELTNVSGWLFFAADDGLHGRELWRSDGTSSGTHLWNIGPGNWGSYPDELTNVDGTLFFTASDNASGVELWTYDGTSESPRMVRDIYPGSFSSFAQDLYEFDGRLVFSASDGVNGRELWESDGTSDGTALSRDIFPGAASSSPSGFLGHDGQLYFTADDGTTGREPWSAKLFRVDRLVSVASLGSWITIPVDYDFGTETLQSNDHVLWVSLSLEPSTEGGTGGAGSALNPANWMLLRDGVDVTSAISTIAVYEAEVSLIFSQPLTSGNYELRAKASIQEKVHGGALDPFSHHFRVLAPALSSSEFLVNTNQTAGLQAYQSIASDAAGNHVIAWAGEGPQDTDGLGVYAQRYDATGAALGTPFLVNSNTGGTQICPAVAMDANGDFVIAWSDYSGHDGSQYGVYAKRYNSAGVPQDAPGTPGQAEFRVNSTTSGYQNAAAVAMDAEGNFVVTWTSAHGGTNDIYAKRFSAAGVAQDVPGSPGMTEFKVNTHTPGNQRYSSVAMSDAGEFTVTWESYEQTPGNGWDVYAKRYDYAGVPLSGEFAVASGPGNQGEAAVASDSLGNLVFTWNAADVNGVGVFGRRWTIPFLMTGGLQPTFQVNTTTLGDQFQGGTFAGTNPLSVADDGTFVVTWNGIDVAGTGVFLQRYDASNARIGGEVAVNTNTSGDQSASAVAVASGSNFVVAWQTNNPADPYDSSSWGVVAKRFDAPPTPGDGETRVNNYTLQHQLAPSVASDAAGNHVVAWYGAGADGVGSDIYARRYAANGVALSDAFRVNTSWTAGEQILPDVAMNADGEFVIAWEDESGHDGDGYGVYARRYSAAGTPLTDEVRINQTTVGQQADPAVAIESSGEFVVTWTTNHIQQTDVMVRRFNAVGSPTMDEARVNTGTVLGAQRDSAIAMDPDGDFVVAWEEYLEPVGSFNVKAQFFTRGASFDGSEILVNQTEAGAQGDPATAYVGQSGGGETFVVVWNSSGQDGSGAGVYGAVLGNVFAGEIRVSGTTLGDQLLANGNNVAHLPGGGFIVTWASADNDGSGSGVYAQRFSALGQRIGGEVRVNAYASGNQANPAIAIDGEGDVELVWQSQNQDGSGYGIYSQRWTLVNRVPQNSETAGPYTVDEGATLLGLTATGSDPDPGDFLTYSWDLNNDGIYGDALGQTVNVPWSTLVSLGVADGPGSVSIRVKAIDSHGASVTSASTTLTVNNSPPTASAGGSYGIAEGGALALSGSGTDPAGAADPLSYSWDVNGDGTFGDATGASPTLTWPQLNALGIAGPTTITNVRVRVSDGDGGTTTSTATSLTIYSPSAGGPYTLAEGATLNLVGSFGLSSAAMSWDVNGDGTFGDAAGATPSLSWLQLQALGITDGPGTINNVRVRVDNGAGGYAVSVSTSLSLANAAPEIPIPGAWIRDPSFDGDGAAFTDFGQNELAWAVARQADGKLVAVGTSQATSFALARYNADGTLDTSFDADGRVSTSFAGGTIQNAAGVILQPDGKIVVAGTFLQGLSVAVALTRYNPDGTLDTTFDGDGWVTASTGFGAFATGVVLQNDGRIVVAGYAIPTLGNWDVALFRFNSNGSLDSTFDGDGKVTTAIGSGSDFAHDVMLQADGKILVGGSTVSGGVDRFALIRYNTNGALDTTFDGDGKVSTVIGSASSAATSLAVQSDGKVILAGYASNGVNNDFALARYMMNGALDTSFDGDGIVTTAIGAFDDVANAVSLQPDGYGGQKILLVGNSQGANPPVSMVVARYTSAGGLDNSFDNDGNISVVLPSGSSTGNAILVEPAGSIILAGESNYDFAVIRLALGLGGPYLIPAGNSLALTSLATDPAGAADPLSYSWDVNGDGTFGDATGATPTLSWSQLNSLGITGVTTITNLRVQVSDGDGGLTTSAATTLTVNAATETRISVVSLDGKKVHNFNTAGVGTLFADATDGLVTPIGGAYDAAGNLYVADVLAGFGTAGSVIKFNSSGTGSTFADLFDSVIAPTGVSFDATGNLYVAAYLTNQIVKVTPAGVGSVFADAADGINRPFDVAVDPTSGNLFVANLDAKQILKVTPAGVASVFADATDGLFSPIGVAVDTAGNVYVSDVLQNKITKFNPAGVGTLFADLFDGVITPTGMSFDAAGNLYVANYLADQVVKITPAGVGSLFADTADGLNHPFDVAIGQVPVSPPPPAPPLAFAAAPNAGSAKTVASWAATPIALEHLTSDVAGLARRIVADRAVDALFGPNKDHSTAQFAGRLLDSRAHAESAQLQRPSRSLAGAALAYRQASLEHAVDGAVSDLYGDDDFELAGLPTQRRHNLRR